MIENVSAIRTRDKRDFVPQTHQTITALRDFFLPLCLTRRKENPERTDFRLNGTALHHAIGVLHNGPLLAFSGTRSKRLQQNPDELRSFLRNHWLNILRKDRQDDISQYLHGLSEEVFDNRVTVPLYNYLQIADMDDRVAPEISYTLQIDGKYEVKGRIDQIRRRRDGTEAIWELKTHIDGDTPLPTIAWQLIMHNLGYGSSGNPELCAIDIAGGRKFKLLKDMPGLRETAAEALLWAFRAKNFGGIDDLDLARFNGLHVSQKTIETGRGLVSSLDCMLFAKEAFLRFAALCRWELLEDQKRISRLNPDTIRSELLIQKGIRSLDEAERYLHPQLSDLTLEYVGLADPMRPEKLEQFNKGISIVQETLKSKRKVAIFGDYDVDGVMSTVLLIGFLKRYANSVGANTDTIAHLLPKREDGYGLTIQAIDTFIEKGQLAENDTLITIDNGITAIEAINYAKSKGIQVVVMDHHTKPQGKKNRADAIIHTEEVCASGIAYIFGRELIGRDIPNALSLVMLATRGDVMRLVKANRIFDMLGHAAFIETQIPGLRALEDVVMEEVRKKTKYVDSYEIRKVIQSMIARWNAPGRTRDPKIAVELLLMKDPQEAIRSARELENSNDERRVLTKEGTRIASAQLKSQASSPAIIVIGDIHPGVLGLVAQDLVKKTGKVSLVYCMTPDGKAAKASGRTVEGFNMYEALEHAANICNEHAKIRYYRQFAGNGSTFEEPIKFGGHEGAGGVTVRNLAYLEMFNKAFVEYVGLHIHERIIKKQESYLLPHVPTMAAGGKAMLEEVIRPLGPFSSQNEDPLFKTDNVRLQDTHINGNPVYLGDRGKHAKLFVEGPSGWVEAMAFSMGEKIQRLDLNKGDAIDIEYLVSNNLFRGEYTLQLVIKKIRRHGTTEWISEESD